MSVKDFVVKLSQSTSPTGNRTDENFQRFIQEGEINGELDRFSQNFVDNLSEKSGQQFGVYANDQKLLTGTLEQVKRTYRNGAQFRFDTGFDRNDRDVEDVFPGLAKQLPDRVHTLEAMAEAFDIKKLSFKPIKDKISKENAEKVAESESVNLFTKLMKPVGAVLTLITAYVTYKRLN